jgi:creatinine amidohydrolase
MTPNQLLTMTGRIFKETNYSKAVFAVGSTEYHGEHLPYGTDALVAEHLAREISDHVEGMLMLPFLPFGMSHHYSSFPVAISLSTETLMRVLTEVYESLRKHGINRLLVINGHDGNIPAIEAASNEYRTAHSEFKIAVLDTWWVTAGELLPPGTFKVWDGLGHGGEGETSMMLHVNPSIVDMRYARGVVPDLPSHVKVMWTFDELTPYGVTGAPEEASAEKGKMMSDALVEHLVGFIAWMDERNWEIKPPS